MEEWQKVREYSSGQDKDTLDNCWRKKGRRMSASASITYSSVITWLSSTLVTAQPDMITDTLENLPFTDY